jgi:glutathione S-transferase-like protein
MTVKLHRCSIRWIKGPHPCWQVQKALDEKGVPYEVVTHPPLRGRRKEYTAMTGGEAKLPAIQLEDGTILREDHKAMVARIREGRLPEGGGAAA